MWCKSRFCGALHATEEPLFAAVPHTNSDTAPFSGLHCCATHHMTSQKLALHQVKLSYNELSTVC